jgi:crotonobetainyl-CoA:carnitine CoA-transferase CaiB-like acyl-CoA transferase
MLDDLRVVELGVWVAGPSAGGILADWGADVIKVEAPDGDPMRRVFNLIAGHGQPESPPFDLDNRGKRSVVLDLATDQGRDDMHRLIATADVFLTNLRPEAIERLGLGPEALLAAHPRLVYASVTGYGRDGPDAGRAGYDVGGFWARTGVAATLTPPGTEPPAGPTPRVQEMNPMVNSYRAGDGKWFWLLGPESDRLFPKVCRALDRLDLLDDERFNTARGRRKNPTLVVTELDREFASMTRDELTARFDEHDVWWAPVHEPADVLEDPQAIAAGAFVAVPEGAGAPAHTAVASPVTFGDGRGRTLRPPPALGEHTAEVLAELDGPDGADVGG